MQFDRHTLVLLVRRPDSPELTNEEADGLQERHPRRRAVGPSVASYAIDDGRRLLLFDPLALPDELEAPAADRETAIVLTCPWHERDTQSLVKRIDVPVYVAPPDTPEDLMDTYGVTAEQAAGFRSPDVCWLLDGDAARARLYAASDRGDTLVDWGQGLEINPRWLRENMTREQIVEQLSPLLERPVEHVLATHGGPTDRAALEHALS